MFQATVACLNQRKQAVHAEAHRHHTEQNLTKGLLGDLLEGSTKADGLTGILLE